MFEQVLVVISTDTKVWNLLVQRWEQWKEQLGILCQVLWPSQGKLTFASGFTPWLENYRRRQWHTTPVLLPGKSLGRRSLVGYSPWGRKESDSTEWLHFPFSLSCIGERNGDPLQCSCLENPRDGGAWWAAVHGVTQSRTWLKRLSSSSSRESAICSSHEIKTRGI